ncbi:MAG TPA: DUF2007 domain-containing protein [Chitinophagaceae bacterium]
MEDQIITLKTFDNPALAHIVRNRLESNNIPCFLTDEHIIGLNPLYNVAMGGVKLNIFEKDYARCMALLNEDVSFVSEETGLEDDQVVTCPACKSSDVGYGGATKNRFGWLTMLISLTLFVYPFSTKKAWHCYNCGEEFENGK